jgi:hypothetical protein
MKLNEDSSAEMELLEEHEVYIFSHLCDLLSFIITNHEMLSKNFLLTHENILKHVAVLMKSPHAYLRLSFFIFNLSIIAAFQDLYRKK